MLTNANKNSILKDGVQTTENKKAIEQRMSNGLYCEQKYR